MQGFVLSCDVPGCATMHFNIFQRQFSLPCVSLEILEPQLDGFAKGNVACGIWNSSFECKGLHLVL